MAMVALCFSGNPRVILAHREEWAEYFEMIRAHHELRIFFHCWSQRGLVVKSDGKFRDGFYHQEIYDSFDNLIAFLKPAAFRIDSPVNSYGTLIEGLGDIYISNNQADPKHILSQIDSVSKADKVRRAYEAEHGQSDVVIKLRFDLRSVHSTTNEIEYLLAHPDKKVLFAPNPGYHVHPGGGGGCKDCHDFFVRERFNPEYSRLAASFLRGHQYHANDICDLFAIARPEVMQSYCSMFDDITTCYRRIKSVFAMKQLDCLLEQVGETGSALQKIVGSKSGGYDIERYPIFVPEKFVRDTMADCIVAHGESMFVIERR